VVRGSRRIGPLGSEVELEERQVRAPWCPKGRLTVPPPIWLSGAVCGALKGHQGFRAVPPPGRWRNHAVQRVLRGRHRRAFPPLELHCADGGHPWLRESRPPSAPLARMGRVDSRPPVVLPQRIGDRQRAQPVLDSAAVILCCRRGLERLWFRVGRGTAAHPRVGRRYAP
jgi:hypothetical protein